MCSQNYFSDLKLSHQEAIFDETKNDVCTKHYFDKCLADFSNIEV
jgi:hypothetical protein